MNEKLPVVAIFDIGKTNKKLLLFDQQYQIVFEEGQQLEETSDDDGFPCEDLASLTTWVKESFKRLQKGKQFEITAVNFSAYGASLVYLDEELKAIPPLFNYLKPYSPQLQNRFFADYGGADLVTKQTASPVLGSLNSGMQLYRIKYEEPLVFERIKWALHLPQYLSFILSSEVNADITSIGSHTMLWDFKNNKYHKWVAEENIKKKLPKISDCSEITGIIEDNIRVGVGLHDSSAALIPYIISFSEPFVLLSTGTWCISLNPFNQIELTKQELDQDCLCYLSYEGKPVKASRLFAGYEHEHQVRRLASFFNKPYNYFELLTCDTSLLPSPATNKMTFGERKLSGFKNYEEAYHQLISDIVDQQIRSTDLVLTGTEVKTIFVDGGFSQNRIYMYLLAEAFSSMRVYAASIPQASALGAALVIHSHWNTGRLPADLIDLKLYSGTQIKA
jgi:sugar (pentulose or hexulose) kinase